MKIKTESRIIKNKIQNILGTGDFSQFRAYLASIESYFSQEKTKLDESFNMQELEERSKTYGEFHREILNFEIGEHFRERSMISFNFPNSFRTALVIQLFSFVEFELKNICEYHAKVKNPNSSYADSMHHWNILKSKNYLNKSANINIKNLNPEWNFIDNVRIIRNHLVHNQGSIFEKDKNFKRVSDFAKKNNLSLARHNENDEMSSNIIVIPEKTMLENLIDNIEKFFRKLEKELKL